jgi:hypothetical protein
MPLKNKKNHQKVHEKKHIINIQDDSLLNYLQVSAMLDHILHACQSNCSSYGVI